MAGLATTALVKSYIRPVVPNNAAIAANTPNITTNNRKIGTTILTATTVTAAQTGTVFLVDSNNDSSFNITLPTPAAGLYFLFVVSDSTGDSDITITTGSSSLEMEGIYNNAGVLTTIPNASSSATWNSSNDTVGDYVEFYGMTTTVWHVRAASAVSGGMTFAVGP